jgi:hypothetical protein
MAKSEELADMPEEDRVEEHSPGRTNEAIRKLTLARLRDAIDRIESIEQRLDELGDEWDIERTLEANAATISLVSLVLGSKWPRLRFLAAAVSGFLLQHAVQGWCPPIEVFRRMGIRTKAEIDRERYALKALRGDFADVPTKGKRESRVLAALEAVEK